MQEESLLALLNINCSQTQVQKYFIVQSIERSHIRTKIISHLRNMERFVKIIETVKTKFLKVLQVGENEVYMCQMTRSIFLRVDDLIS